MAYTAKKRLYLNADRTKLVEEGSPDAAFLLAAEGAEVPDAEAKRYGLTGGSKASADEDEKTADAKARKAPPEDKGA